MPVLRDNSGAFGTPVSDSERTMVYSGTVKFLMIFFNFSGESDITNWITLAKDLLEQ